MSALATLEGPVLAALHFIDSSDKVRRHLGGGKAGVPSICKFSFG